MVIVHGGDQCTCGRKGCWERYASANALIRQTMAAMEASKDSAMWTLVGGDLSNLDGRSYQGIYPTPYFQQKIW